MIVYESIHADDIRESTQVNRATRFIAIDTEATKRRAFYDLIERLGHEADYQDRKRANLAD